ncbi:hypothetical protein N7478_009277 [Penicillium angulare]|uniref:uncharacterized protein n=1 Tax=Penicillium angulare TaxID=116970 RepID=UPI0025411110|nr:uncharacterized protein N7478_009277 [Penicillium angulare]KAJ5266469.1 hypothetical protein N7478_009277 [Penicillium angulare]
MSSSVEHVDACVPTTALKALQLGDQHLILQGQGPFLRIIHENSGDVVARLRVFKRNNVHGFLALPSQNGSEQSHVQLLVWGGQSLRVVNLIPGVDNAIESAPGSAEFLAPDWIMSGCAAAKDHALTAYLVTANNVLLALTLKQSTSSDYKNAIHIYQLATNVKSILCAADLVALSPTHILITAGTIFGEIIVWSCFTDEKSSVANSIGSIHHFFTGHDGTVFGVQISPYLKTLHGSRPGRLLASCSDDRTVRIWDISDCEGKTASDPSAYSTDGFDLRSTGFGPTEGEDTGVRSEMCVAKAFGHGARIWSALFRPSANTGISNIGLVTRGEDAVCIAWDLSWVSSDTKPTTYKLTQQFSSHAHLGKHLWSMDIRSCSDKTIVYTGGADGALRSFQIDETKSSVSTPVTDHWQARPGKNTIMHLAFVEPNTVIACDIKSLIQIGYVRQDPAVNVTWETLHIMGDFGAVNRLIGIPEKGLALISNANGHIILYNHRLKSVSDLVGLSGRPMSLFVLQSTRSVGASNQEFCFLASYAQFDIATLVMVTECDNDCRKVEVVSINLPQSPFQISSASLIHNDDYLLLGSRLGGLSVHRVSSKDSSTEPLIVDRRVHGHEGTNHIQPISSVKGATGSTLEYVLTGGRDGRICVHELNCGSNANDPIGFFTVHRIESALAGAVEGAYIDEVTGDLLVYGYRSQNFVLHNETKQSDIISVTTGGARRTWTFHPHTKDGQGGLLCWKDPNGLQVLHIKQDDNRLIRAGIHGREIKALDSLKSIQGSPPLFVTGAEDTMVRVFSLTASATSNPWGCFETCRVLKTHRSGIQHASWSKNGKFLFTSAAEEEFFVWSVCWIPSFGLATKLVAKGPKTDRNSELRITSFDVVEVEETGNECAFLICLTLSNSMVRILHYSPNNGNSFSLIAKGRYMTNCLTEGHLLVHASCVTLMTAATDGYMTLWDLTTTLRPFYTIDSNLLKSKPSLSSSQPPVEDISCEDRYRIHSNSVKALEKAPITPTLTMIVSGGDDNSLSISLLKHSLASATGTDTAVSTTSIPDAHAASITAVKILKEPRLFHDDNGMETVQIMMASSGNDHRVKIWMISLDPSTHDAKSIQIRFIKDQYSAVADVSSLGLVSETENFTGETKAQLLVCGVGMEMFETKI